MTYAELERIFGAMTLGENRRNIRGGGWDDVETKTAAEWAMSNGRGFLCSTEY